MTTLTRKKQKISKRKQKERKYTMKTKQEYQFKVEEYPFSVKNLADDDLKSQVRKLNDAACQCIIQEQYKEARKILIKAQKIVNSLTKSHQQINKYLLACIFQNIACMAQGFWQFQKSLAYLEKTVKTIKKLMKSNNFGVIRKIQQIYIAENLSKIDLLKLDIEKINMLGIYYLQLSAINSQVNQHETAYNYIIQAIKSFKSMCQKSVQVQKHILSENDFLYFNHTNSQIQIFQELLFIIQPILQGTTKNKITKYYYKTIQQNIKNIYLKSKNDQICNRQKETAMKFIEEFKIADVMQIKPINFDTIMCKMNEFQNRSEINILMKVFNVSVCLFAMSVQKRFCCILMKNKKNMQKVNQNIKQSQFYHLQAITLILRFIPIRCHYLEHLIQSFNNNFEIDLLQLLRYNPMYPEISPIKFNKYQQQSNDKKQINDFNKSKKSDKIQSSISHARNKASFRLRSVDEASNIHSRSENKKQMKTNDNNDEKQEFKVSLSSTCKRNRENRLKQNKNKRIRSQMNSSRISKKQKTIMLVKNKSVKNQVYYQSKNKANKKKQMQDTQNFRSIPLLETISTPRKTLSHKILPYSSRRKK